MLSEIHFNIVATLSGMLGLDYSVTVDAVLTCYITISYISLVVFEIPALMTSYPDYGLLMSCS